LVFAVGCNVITGSAAWTVTSIAVTLMVSIYALGGISGANFNPAVSFALALNKTLAWDKAGKYMLVQIVAGIVAGFTYAAMFWDVFNLAPASGYDWKHAFLAEFLYTFMLVFAVLNTAVSRHNGCDVNEFYGLAIGFSVIAGGYGAGHISGGCFNPAVAFGIDVSSAGVGFGWCLAYTLFELLGATAAYFVYTIVRDDEKSPEKNEAKGKTARLVSEFLGTFMLVLTVGLNVLGGSKAPVWSIAAALMVMIYSLGDVSGGHFNPAVTLAIWVSKTAPQHVKPDLILYMLVQIVGGLLGGLTYSVMEKGTTFPLEPGAGHTWLSAYFLELVFTFLLCYTVLSVACIGKYGPCANSFFGFTIASCVTAGGYAIGSVSGGALNPAVAIGIAVSSLGNGHGVFHMFPYAVFELVGGAVAAVVFGFTHKAMMK